MLQATLMDVPLSTLNMFSGSRDRRITLQQRIPFPGKKSYESDAATADIRRTVADDRQRQLTIRTAGKVLYIAAVGRSELLAVLSEQRVLLEEMISAVESRYSVGRASYADLLRLRIEREHLDNLTQDVRTERQTTLYRMNELRGLDPTALFGELAPLRGSLPSVPLDSLLSMATDNRPELARVAAMRRESQAQAGLAARSYWPDLTVGAGYRNSLLMGDTWEVMFGVSIPIAPWASGDVSGRVQESAARVREAEAQISATSLMILQETAETYQSAHLHHDRLQRYTTRILPDAKETMQSLRAGYLTNQTDFLSFIDSFRSIETFHLESVQEEMAFLSSLALLEQAVGTDLRSYEQETER